MDLKTAVRSIPDFPKPGILFRDVTTLFQDPEAFRQLIDELAKSLEGKQVDLVVGPEARGFVVGSALAYALNAGLVLARKPGKLPCESLRYEYALEYGTARMELRPDTIHDGQRILIIDDVLATGGTARASVDLVERAGGKVMGLAMLMELLDLGGRSRLEGYDVESVLAY